MKSSGSSKMILEDLYSLLERGGREARDLGLEAAMYLEDCFGLVLSDEEIESIDPSDPDSLGRLLAAKGVA
jgi:hypothetical protein